VSARALTIVGAGFSGLVTAFEAVEAGFTVEVIESAPDAGGLIRTLGTPWGPVETAANGVLNSPLVQRLARAAGVELQGTRSVSRRRYLWRQSRAHRWPLGFWESCVLIVHLLKTALFRAFGPRPGESVATWGDRVLGTTARKFLLTPILQGIYAEAPEKLSAHLLFARFRRSRRDARRRLLAGFPVPTLKGTVAPEGGLGELLKGLEAHLRTRGVVFRYDLPFTPTELNQRLARQPVVLAVNLSSAVKLLVDVDGGASARLSRVPRLPLATTTLFYAPHPRDLQGFGVLFPRGEGVEALGVLFNSEIFEGRGPHRSETWIVRAPPRGDAELLQLLAHDRKVLTGRADSPLGYRIQRWPEALPGCGRELEDWLRDGYLERFETRGLYCVGNWTGTLGLSQIALRAREIIQRMRDSKT